MNMKKIEKNDWFSTALSIMEREGFSKITIENLCSRLKVTKGSFYHHFKNMDDYIEAFMKYWLNDSTMNLIKETERIENINQRQEVIRKLAIERPQKYGQIIRAWSYSNDIVKKYLQEADATKLEYLITLRIANGTDKENAKYISMIEYALLVGIQQLFPDMPNTELEQLYEIYKTKLLS